MKSIVFDCWWQFSTLAGTFERAFCSDAMRHEFRYVFIIFIPAVLMCHKANLDRNDLINSNTQRVDVVVR